MVRMPIVLLENLFAPEIIAPNVSVSKVQGALVRLETAIVLMIRGNVVAHREGTSDNGPVGVTQRLKIGFGDVGIEMVSSEGLPPDRDFDAICLSRQANLLSLSSACLRPKRYRHEQ